MTGNVKIIEPDERFVDEDPRFSWLADDWVHPTHATDSDRYYADRRDCMAESDTGGRTARRISYDPDRFDVCMKAQGWRRR